MADPLEDYYNAVSKGLRNQPAAFDRHTRTPITFGPMYPGELGVNSEDALSPSKSAITINRKLQSLYNPEDKVKHDKVVKHELIHSLQRMYPQEFAKADNEFFKSKGATGRVRASFTPDYEDDGNEMSAFLLSNSGGLNKGIENAAGIAGKKYNNPPDLLDKILPGLQQRKFKTEAARGDYLKLLSEIVRNKVLAITK